MSAMGTPFSKVCVRNLSVLLDKQIGDRRVAADLGHHQGAVVMNQIVRSKFYQSR